MKAGSKKSKKNKTTHFLDAGNRLLFILILGLFAHALVKYFSADQNVIPTIVGRDASAEEISLLAMITGEPKPAEMYVQRIGERDLFRSLRDRLKSPGTHAIEKALPALHKRIKLIGILVDGDSKAIVEDLKEKQTHFLSQGESIGTAFLEDIREDKVIFMYNDERVEMTP